MVSEVWWVSSPLVPLTVFPLGIAGDVDLADAERQMVEYRKALENHNIRRARQIINADETGLFFKALPTYTYVRSEDADEIRGSKNMAAKDRVTVQLMATADGVKGPTFVIGKQKKPRCFNGATLPGDVVYTNQSSAWMDRVTCQYWVDNVLTPWKRQILPGEKVRVGWVFSACKADPSTPPPPKAVLIFDNAPAHIDLKFPDDSVVMLLPPNLTCIYQPMDQGIISAFKRLYKTAILDTVDGLLPVSFSVGGGVVANFQLLKYFFPNPRTGHKSVRMVPKNPMAIVD